MSDAEGSGAVNLLQRWMATLSAKANEVLDRYDDSAEALDYAFQLLVDQVAKARQAGERLAVAEQRLVEELARLEQIAAGLEDQGSEEVQAGRDDLAREALARCNVLRTGAASLAAERDGVADEDGRFNDATERLEQSITVRAAQIAALNASYSVSGVKTEIESALTETREDVANVSGAVTRADARAAQLHSQAARIDALLASGTLRDLTCSPEEIGIELDAARVSKEVEQRLASIKANPPRKSQTRPH